MFKKKNSPTQQLCLCFGSRGLALAVDFGTRGLDFAIGPLEPGAFLGQCGRERIALGGLGADPQRHLGSFGRELVD
jgi:hypothetical protein